MLMASNSSCRLRECLSELASLAATAQSLLAPAPCKRRKERATRFRFLILFLPATIASFMIQGNFLPYRNVVLLCC